MPKLGMATSINPTAPPLEITSLDQSNDSATTALYRAVIGPINSDYYLPIFSRFEAHDKAGASWNWAASLSTLNWMAFRHLWGAALVYIGGLVGASLVVFGVGRMVFQFSEMAEIALWIALGAATFILPGLYGNALFHADSRKKMAAALTVTKTLLEACALLNKQVASRQRFIWLTLINLALAGVLTGVYMTFSAIRSQATQPAAVMSITDLSPILATAAYAPIITPASSAPTPVSSGSALPPAPAASASSVPLPEPYITAAPALIQEQDTPLKPDRPALEPTPQAIPTALAQAPKATTLRPAQAALKTTSRYFINVGLFAKETNALSAHAKLLAAGLPAHKQAIKTAKGQVIRVRVGPFDTQSSAHAAAKKISALKLDAVVTHQ